MLKCRSRFEPSRWRKKITRLFSATPLSWPGSQWSRTRRKAGEFAPIGQQLIWGHHAHTDVTHVERIYCSQSTWFHVLIGGREPEGIQTDTWTRKTPNSNPELSIEPETLEPWGNNTAPPPTRGEKNVLAKPLIASQYNSKKILWMFYFDWLAVFKTTCSSCTAVAKQQAYNFQPRCLSATCLWWSC